MEWKAFEVSNVNLEQMDKLISAHKFEEGLLRILNSKTRLPVSQPIAVFCFEIDDE